MNAKLGQAGTQTGSFSSALGKQKAKRGKRKQTDNYTGISSLLASEFIQPLPPREQHSFWKLAQVSLITTQTTHCWNLDLQPDTAQTSLCTCTWELLQLVIQTKSTRTSLHPFPKMKESGIS